MWFKNLILFRFTETFTYSETDLEELLQHQNFRPCGNLEPSSFGWTSPLGRHSELLVHSGNGFMMICARKEEKLLPASVINEFVADRVAEIEDQQGRPVRRKEREGIRDEVIFELLPKAFSRSVRTYAYIDPRQGSLVVDAASDKKAEELLTLLRDSLGTLSAVPPATNERPTAIMTSWLSHSNIPSDITLEDECELRATDQESSIVGCKKHDLSSPEIAAHLKAGKEVIKLAVSWNDRITFVLNQALEIKRLRFLDVVQDQAAEVTTDDERERFDVDFSIMTLELAEFFPRLFELFGNERKEPIKPAANVA